MSEKLYLEITYGDNDWANTMNNILPSIRYTLQDFRSAFSWSEDMSRKEFNTFTSLIRKLIAAQLNFEQFFWEGKNDYDYSEDVEHIYFDIVRADEIESNNNYETVYIQLYGSDREYGEWFFV